MQGQSIGKSWMPFVVMASKSFQEAKLDFGFWA
jgi:hypothetical protein